MIKVNELRIGNYIERNGVTATVEIINGELDEVYFLGQDFYYADCSYNLQPISLSRLWLIKLGFQVTHYAYLRFYINLLETEIYLRPSLDKWYWGFVNDNNDCEINDCYELSYVHELQNLVFALTKEELTTN